MPNQLDIMKFFSYDHLPDGPGKDTSKQICDMAKMMEDNLPHCPERSAGLRKLLEAKDCFVRATLP